MQIEPDRGERALLSIDPGARSGVVIVTMSLPVRLLHHSVWNKNSKNSNRRPSHIVAVLYGEYNIQCAVIEEQYLHHNPKTAMTLSRTAGAWEEACLAKGIPVHWFNASAWQKIIIGKGRGKGKQIESAYMKIAEQDTGVTLQSDESAAWCIARCQVSKMATKNR